MAFLTLRGLFCVSYELSPQTAPVPGVCACVFRVVGEDYILPHQWEAEYGAKWTTFLVAMYLQHGLLWLLAVFLGCIRARPKTNFHTLCVGLLLTATSVKFVWLVDPGGFHHLLSPAARSCTLRIPQIIWFIVVMFFIAMWYEHAPFPAPSRASQ